MADISDITTKAFGIIGVATDYLTTRQGVATAPAELAEIQGWHAKLNESSANIAAMIQAATAAQHPVVVAEDAEPALDLLSEHLDLTQKHIKALNNSDEFIKVDFALDTLQHHLSILAGPHGPGRGRPGPVRPNPGRPGTTTSGGGPPWGGSGNQGGIL